MHLIKRQRLERGWKGFIATQPNCTTTGLAVTLRPLMDRFELEPFLINDLWAMEEKFNGTRKQVIKGGDVLAITNKKGQPTSKGMLPKPQAEFLKVP